MKISREQEEKLVMIIQALIGVMVLVFSIKNSTKTQSAQMKKTMAKNAKRIGKLNKMEYKMQKKAIKQQYSGK